METRPSSSHNLYEQMRQTGIGRADLGAYVQKRPETETKENVTPEETNQETVVISTPEPEPKVVEKPAPNFQTTEPVVDETPNTEVKANESVIQEETSSEPVVKNVPTAEDLYWDMQTQGLGRNNLDYLVQSAPTPPDTNVGSVPVIIREEQPEVHNEEVVAEVVTPPVREEVVAEVVTPPVQEEVVAEVVTPPVQEEVVAEVVTPPVQEEIVAEVLTPPVQEEVVAEVVTPPVQEEVVAEVVTPPVQEEVVAEVVTPPVQEEVVAEVVTPPVQEEVVAEVVTPPVQKEVVAEVVTPPQNDVNEQVETPPTPPSAHDLYWQMRETGTGRANLDHLVQPAPKKEVSEAENTGQGQQQVPQTGESTNPVVPPPLPNETDTNGASTPVVDPYQLLEELSPKPVEGAPSHSVPTSSEPVSEVSSEPSKYMKPGAKDPYERLAWYETTDDDYYNPFKAKQQQQTQPVYNAPPSYHMNQRNYMPGPVPPTPYYPTWSSYPTWMTMATGMPALSFPLYQGGWGWI